MLLPRQVELILLRILMNCHLQSPPLYVGGVHAVCRRTGRKRSRTATSIQEQNELTGFQTYLSTSPQRPNRSDRPRAHLWPSTDRPTLQLTSCSDGGLSFRLCFNRPVLRRLPVRSRPATPDHAPGRPSLKATVISKYVIPTAYVQHFRTPAGGAKPKTTYSTPDTYTTLFLPRAKRTVFS